MSFTCCVAKPAAGQRNAVLSRATPDRRALIAGLVGGVASLSAGKALADATPVDLFDDRTRVKGTGFDIIYEARDLDLPQNVRDGISQYRGDLAATKARFKDSAARIQGSLGTYVSKSYWTEAQEELRNQVGTMRQDINTLVAAKPSKAERKEGYLKGRAFIEACESLDFAIKSKDLASATKLYAKKLMHTARKLEETLDIVNEELPGLAASARLTGLELADCIVEFSNLGKEVTGGLKAGARALQSTEATLHEGGQAIKYTWKNRIVPGFNKRMEASKELIDYSLQTNAALAYSDEAPAQVAATTKATLREIRKLVAAIYAMYQISKQGLQFLTHISDSDDQQERQNYSQDTKTNPPTPTPVHSNVSHESPSAEDGSTRPKKNNPEVDHQ